MRFINFGIIITILFVMTCISVENEYRNENINILGRAEYSG